MSPEVEFESAAGRWVLAVAVLGSGIAFLDGTVVNVALPAIGGDLDATHQLAAVDPQRLPADARVADPARRLARRPLRPPAGLRRSASSGSRPRRCCARSRRTSRCSIVARLLQGVGGALLTPGSLAMIEASFRPGDRARAIGAWSGLRRRRRRARAAARRLAGRGGLLAGDLPDQPAARARSSIAGGDRGTSPRRATRRRRAGSTCRARCSRRSGSAGTTYALIEAPERGCRRRSWSAAIGGRRWR